MNDLLILGIESSCDDTSASVLRGSREVLSNVISSQTATHQKFGGVVPELASREHAENIVYVIQTALAQAKVKLEEISAIAVTQGPGLVGSLIVGLTAAKSISLIKKIPLIGVHHIAGHIYANHIERELEFPLISLVVSGGHTELIYMENHNKFKKIGRTMDDAVGEAFDKVARVMGFSYPGGPIIDKLAAKGIDEYKLPRSWMGETLNFSFSGVKSAVINLLHNAKQKNEEINTENLSASFQNSIIEVLESKSAQAIKRYGAKHFLLAGGVAANSALRNKLKNMCSSLDVTFSVPRFSLCADNAAMIACAGYFKYIQGKKSYLAINAEPNFKLEEYFKD